MLQRTSFRPRSNSSCVYLGEQTADLSQMFHRDDDVPIIFDFLDDSFEPGQFDFFFVLKESLVCQSSRFVDRSHQQITAIENLQVRRQRLIGDFVRKFFISSERPEQFQNL